MCVPRTLAENPIFQREMRILRRDRHQRRSIAVLWGVFLALFLIGAATPRQTAVTLTYALFLTHAIVAIVGALSAGAACITREHEQRTWDAVILTRMAPHEILLGKAAVAFLSAIVPALPAALLGLLLTPAALAVGPSLALPLPVVLSGEAFLLSLVALYVVLSVRLSVVGERTTTTVARVASAVFLSLALLWWAQAIPPLLLPACIGTSQFVLRVSILCLLTSVLAGALLLGAAGSLAGPGPSYGLAARVAGAVAYLLLLCYLAVVLGVAPTRIAQPGVPLLLAHSALLGAILAGVCACAGEPGRAAQWSAGSDVPSPATPRRRTPGHRGGSEQDTSPTGPLGLVAFSLIWPVVRTGRRSVSEQG